ncbi:hypothetical protein [Nodosilinea nodulosa]|uniref:hypothetical protein n=1 Tax=Nodosilinea nodulosa TaxID=416001 RepID=UPI00031FB7F1|nr:hypothetical protein [Nodosilinea nodulosa]
MNILKSIQRGAIALCLGLILLTTSACGSATQTSAAPGLSPTAAYGQLERGDTASGESYGRWVMQTAKGLVSDAFVRDNDKLGVVIAPEVKPQEVKTLAQSLVQGFHKKFPNRDLSVLVYAPDKQLILTANYDDSTRQVEYQ